MKGRPIPARPPSGASLAGTRFYLVVDFNIVRPSPLVQPMQEYDYDETSKNCFPQMMIKWRERLEEVELPNDTGKWGEGSDNITYYVCEK